MHLTLIFIVIISYSTAYSHPLLSQENQWKPQQHELGLESRQNDELDSSTSRPLQELFRKILSAFRLGSRTTPSPTTTTQRSSVTSSYHQQQIELQEIPNFVDFSTYLLGSFMNNNSAIKFSYLQPNTTNLRGGNYSVVSFLIPQNWQEKFPQKGFFNQFLDLFKLPWTREPAAKPPPGDTVFSNFPPFLEYFAQRVQAYYSIYKYTDESRLNNTIVLTIPDIMSDEISQQQSGDETLTNEIINDDNPSSNDDPFQQPLNDDIIETTTDYLMETTDAEEEDENELETTTTTAS